MLDQNLPSISYHLAMNVVITGAAGFIGSNLLKLLIAKGHTITPIDNFDATLYSKEIKVHNLTATEYQGKILQNFPTAIPEKSVDQIVHLAALPGLFEGPNSVESYTKANVLGTMQMLNFAKLSGAKRVIYISTSSVYGLSGVGKETIPIKPISTYGVTKFVGEELVRAHCEENSIEFIILRLFSVFGPKQRPDMAIHKILFSLLCGETFPVYGNLETERTNTYVSDVCLAILNSMESKIPNQCYNICGERKISLRQWIELAEEVSGRKLKLQNKEARSGEQKITQGDPTRAKSEIGFKNSISLEEGLQIQMEEIMRNLELYQKLKSSYP